MTAPGCLRGTSVPSRWYARSAYPSATSAQPGPGRDLGQGGPGQAEHGQLAVVVHDGRHDRRRLPHVHRRRVVERAVRLDVADLLPLQAAEPVQRGDLVDDLVAQLDRLVLDPAPAEPGQVPVADLGADRDPAVGRLLAQPAHGDRVAGVEAAGDVRAGDHARAAPRRRRGARCRTPRRGPRSGPCARTSPRAGPGLRDQGQVGRARPRRPPGSRRSSDGRPGR